MENNASTAPAAAGPDSQAMCRFVVGRKFSYMFLILFTIGMALSLGLGNATGTKADITSEMMAGYVIGAISCPMLGVFLVIVYRVKIPNATIDGRRSFNQRTITALAASLAASLQIILCARNLEHYAKLSKEKKRDIPKKMLGSWVVPPILAIFATITFFFLLRKYRNVPHIGHRTDRPCLPPPAAK